jgi:hypothetical protein
MIKNQLKISIPSGRNLFWDADIAEIDYDLNSKSIIARFIEYGTIEDIYACMNFYGRKRFIEDLQKSNLNKEYIPFACIMFDLDKSNF